MRRTGWHVTTRFLFLAVFAAQFIFEFWVFVFDCLLTLLRGDRSPWAAWQRHYQAFTKPFSSETDAWNTHHHHFFHRHNPSLPLNFSTQHSSPPPSPPPLLHVPRCTVAVVIAGWTRTLPSASSPSACSSETMMVLEMQGWSLFPRWLPIYVVILILLFMLLILLYYY